MLSPETIKLEFIKLVSLRKFKKSAYSVNLGTVKDRIGSGHEYLIEWANQDNKQTCSIQHLVSLIQHRKKNRKKSESIILVRIFAQMVRWTPRIRGGS